MNGLSIGLVESVCTDPFSGLSKQSGGNYYEFTCQRCHEENEAHQYYKSFLKGVSQTLTQGLIISKGVGCQSYEDIFVIINSSSK